MGYNFDYRYGKSDKHSFYQDYMARQWFGNAINEMYNL